MSTESYLLEKKEKSWAGRLLKLIFILCCFCLVIAMVLFNMGGSDDTLKEHIESYMSRTLGGRPAKVEKLVNMSFFPRVGMDIQGAVVTGNSGGDYPVLEIGRLQAYMSFFSVATSSPRFTNLYIENAKALKGLFIPRELYIEKLYVDHDLETGEASLRANGRMDIHQWSLQVGLDVFGKKKGKFSYALSDRLPLNIEVADIKISATIVNEEYEFFKIENLIISTDEQSMKGGVVLSVLAPRMLKAQANLDLPSEGSSVEAEVVFDLSQVDHKYSGTVKSANLDMNDIVGDAKFIQILRRIYDVLGYAELSKSGDAAKDLLLRGDKDIDLTFDIQKLKYADQEPQPLRFAVKKNDGFLKLGPFMNDQSRLPALFVLKDKAQEGAYNLLIRDGALDPAFAARWVSALPPAFLGQESLDVSCGVGRFTLGHDALHLNTLALKTSAGGVSLSDQKVASGLFADLNFKNAKASADLNPLSLKKEAYDFVQSSLQRSAKTSPCAQYVQLLEDAKQPEKENKEQE